MNPRLVSFLRHLLTALGGLLIGDAWFNGSLIFDAPMIEGLVGCAMTLIGTAMSIMNKEADIEMVLGALRQLMSTLGGIVMASGKMDAEQYALWTGLIISAAALLQGKFSRKKNQQIKSGDVSPHQLKS